MKVVSEFPVAESERRIRAQNPSAEITDLIHRITELIHRVNGVIKQVKYRIKLMSSKMNGQRGTPSNDGPRNETQQNNRSISRLATGKGK